MDPLEGDLQNQLAENIQLKQMNFFQRIIGIFTSPSESMRSLEEKPRILFPILLILLTPFIGIMSRYSQLEEMLRESMNSGNAQQQAQMTPDQIDTMIKVLLFVLPIIIPIVLGILWVVGTAILFGLTKAFGGQGKFKQYLSVTGYSMVITLAFIVLTVAVSFITSNFNMKLSLGVLLADTKGSFAKGFFSAILNAIDLFTIWYLIVVGIGVMMVSKLSKVKVYSLLFSLYGLMTLLSALLSGLGAARM